MKRIISLIISASIFLPIVVPMTSIITFAQTGDLHGLRWEKNKSLDRRLKEHGVKTGEGEALVSWNLEDVTGSYILEYFVEDETNTGAAEKVQFTFNRETIGNNATVDVKVLNPLGVEITKEYRRYIIDEDDWVKMEDDELIPVGKRNIYPGGSIFVGTQMEIRFKWVDETIYVQTNSIKSGNITPFSLKHETWQGGQPDKIEVLTGLEGYKISPIHIELKDTKIANKKVIFMPGEDTPGSKPGVQIEFKRPRRFFDEDEGGFKFDKISDEDAKAIKASLEIKDSINQAGQLTFNLGDSSSVNGLGNTKKKWEYDEEKGIYKLYLAEEDEIDDEIQDNIIKWDALQGSLIFNEVNLSLSKERETGPVQALGIFKPIEKDKDGDIGRYTYLKYTIKRSSLQDAYIEIHPYRMEGNTDFTYSVQVAGDGANWETLVEHNYTTTDTDSYSPIRIPVPFSETYVERSYQIVVKYNQGIIKSQELRYDPQEDSTIPPPTPLIQEIDNIYVVAPVEEEGNPEAIGFDLIWSAPRNSSDNKVLEELLKKGNLYYELVLYDTPEAPKGTGTLIKVFKVSKEDVPGSQIKVEPYAGTAGKEGVEANGRHNSSRNTFTMENVVLKNWKSIQDGWEQVVMPSDYDNAEMIKKYPVEGEFVVNDGLTDKEVPGIYYLTMRGLYEPKASGEPTIPMGISTESTPKSITISPLKEVIPVPTKIESTHLLDEEGLGRTRQSFSWGNVDLTRYIRQMLDPLNLSIGAEGERTYEIYLYQKGNILESELTDITTSSGITLELPNNYKLKDEHIESLRNNEVLRFDYSSSSNAGMNNIVFEGLDANQVYYTKIRVRLDLKDKDNHAIQSRHSVFSKEHSFTTDIKPSEPGAGERVPPVPEELTIVDQLNNTTATIGWKAPNYNIQEGERLYYEMVRVDSRTLAKEEDSRLISIEDLMSKDAKNEIEAWHTEKTYIDQYEKSTNSWKEVDPQQLSNKLQLKDENLNPNNIYYYYVRTVLIVDGEQVYSSWVGIPVTTDPIQKPIRLKVENTEAYAHDPKREIVVSFLAPIPKGSDIPRDYDFDIAVQGELDEDYRLDYSTTRLTSKEEDENIPTGYDHFVYKISNAKPGKRYDIKVRVIDKVVDMVNGQYPKSLYSDRVSTRTHFDQDEQDKEDKFEEYLKYFEDKVEALRRKPYWTLEDGSSEFSIKYRSNYIIPGINNTKTYPLDVREGVTDFTYYMPASVVASTNLNQTSFEIKQGNVTYSVRPSTITTELEELKETLEDISVKRIRDYYVAFYFRQIPQATSSGIDGYLTPKIMVDIELIRLKEEDLFLEDDIMIALNNEINSEKIRFINELERALERGRILNEDLDRLINNSVATIEKRHQREVKSILGRNMSKTVPIDHWNKAMLIMAMVEGSAIAQGYMLGRTDIELPTFNVAGGYGLEATRAGTYAFRGQKITMPVIPGVSGANNLIAKYQLTDFFGINGVINPNNMAIKKDVLGATARVLGAPRGADYIQYLKQRNIKGITNTGMNLPIKKGEGIYLLMQVYEAHLKKPIGSVYINNRNAVPNIRTFNSIHQPYVTVAVDSKIISIGSGIKPNDTMQIKDVLQMLTNIMAGLR